MSHEHIFSELLSDPYDRESLLVAADRLSEAGSALGELIVLQIEGGSEARGAELRAQIEHEIVGEPGDDPSYAFEWEAGFIRRASFSVEVGEIGHPALALLEELSIVFADESAVAAITAAKLPLARLRLEFSPQPFETDALFSAYPALEEIVIVSEYEEPPLGNLDALVGLKSFEICAATLERKLIETILAARWPELACLSLSSGEPVGLAGLRPLLRGEVHKGVVELGIFGLTDVSDVIRAIAAAPIAARLTGVGLYLDTDDESEELLQAHADLFSRLDFFDPPETGADAEDDADTLYRRGYTFARILGRYEEAADLLSRAVEISPEDKICWLELADVLDTLERNEEALEALTHADGDDELAPGVNHLRARLLLGVGKGEEARALAISIAEVEGAEAADWHLLAFTERELGNTEAALEAFDRALEHGFDVDLVSGKAEVFESKYRFADAAKCYARIIADADDDGDAADAFADKAACELAAGDLAAASATTREGLQRFPDHPRLVASEAEAQLTLAPNGLERAVEILERFIAAHGTDEVDLDDDRVGVAYGRALICADRADDAARFLEARGGAEHDLDAALTLALAYAETGSAKLDDVLEPHEEDLFCPQRVAIARLAFALASAEDRAEWLSSLLAGGDEPASVVAAIAAAEPDREWHSLDPDEEGSVRNDRIVCAALATLAEVLVGNEPAARRRFAALATALKAELGPPYVSSDDELAALLAVTARRAPAAAPIAADLTALLYGPRCWPA